MGLQVETSTVRRTKSYRDLSIDAALDTRLLDHLNAFAPRVRLVSTCAGHPDGAHFTFEVCRRDLASLVVAIPLVDSITCPLRDTDARALCDHYGTDHGDRGKGVVATGDGARDWRDTASRPWYRPSPDPALTRACRCGS